MEGKNKQFVMLMLLAGVLVIGLGVLTGCKKQSQPAASSEAPAPANVASVATMQTICPAMGNPIDKNVYTEYKGKKVYFCCKGCVAKFEADPEKYLAKLPQFEN